MSLKICWLVLGFCHIRLARNW